MTEEIKDILKRYDEIGALILEQKLDEYADKIGQVPEGSDAASFEEYLQQEAKEETEKAKKVLESEPDEKLGGKSLREYFDGLTLEEKEEALEYSAVNLDCGVPESLIASIASDDRESVRDYCSTVIGNSAWTEDELDDQDKLFEIEYQKVKACLDVLIEMKEFCFVKAVIDRFMSYHQTKEFVAESIKDYVVGAADVSVPILMDIIEENLEDGLEGPAEDIVIMLAEQLDCTVKLLPGDKFAWVGRDNSSGQDVQVGVPHALAYLLVEQVETHVFRRKEGGKSLLVSRQVEKANKSRLSDVQSDNDDALPHQGQ